MTAAGLVGLATPSYAADPLTVSPPRGPSAGGNTITLTTSGADFSGSSAVEFSWNACAATYTAAAAPTASATSPFPLTAGIVVTPGANTTWSAGSAKTLSVVVPANLALTATPAQTTSSWYVCVYGGTTPGVSTLTHNTASAAYTISGSALTLSTNQGPSAGTPTISATASAGALTAANAVEFQYVGTGVNAGCAATWQTPTAIAVTGGTQTAGVISVPTANVTLATGTTNKLNIVVPSSLALGTNQQTGRYNVCVYSAGTATGTVVAQTTTPYTVAGAPLALNVNQGPSGGGNGLTATSTATFAAGTTVEFQYAGTGSAGYCSPTYVAPASIAVSGTPPVQTAGVLLAATRVIAPTKLAITVPTALLLTGGQTAASYHVCAYSGSTAGTSALLAATAGTTPYAIAAVSMITSVSPTAGSAQGGTTVTVSGSNFPSDLTATVGGAAMRVTSVAADGNSFTAVAPAHAPGGPLAISVVTSAGTATKQNAFTYTNGITILSDKFAPNNKLTTTDLDVTGTGFTALDFSHTDGSTPRSADSHVYLVHGTYDPTVNTTNKTVGPDAECLNVLVISDTELVCQLDLPVGLTAAEALDAAASRSVNLTTTLGSNTVTATGGGTFSAADVGMPITVPSATEFANTTIASVTDATHAVLTVAGSGVIAGTPTATVGSLPAITGVGVTANSYTITGTFPQGAVGKLATGTGLAPGTVITSVNAGGTSATISMQGLTSTTSSVTLTYPNPVPNGTYTLTIVSNGTVGGQSATGYTQTVVSSGSTFTVADY
jgi:hypothetical protein